MIATKKCVVVFTVFMFLTSLAMVSVPVQSQTPPIFYVDQPEGYIPAKPKGIKFWVDILVNASDLTYNGADGIAGYGLRVEVDPTVLKPTAVSSPTGGYFLFDFYINEFLPSAPILLSSINETVASVDIGEQFVPTPGGGAATDGVLSAPYKLVSIEFQSLSLYSNTTIDITSAWYMNTSGSWNMVDARDGEYRGAPQIPVEANLVARKGWPEHHRFDRSKDGDPLVPDSHGTPGVQTFYAKIKNTGDLNVTVRAVFQILGGGGEVEPAIVTANVTIDPGDIVIVQGDLRPLEEADEGKWIGLALCEYYNPYSEVWVRGTTTRTLAFNVVA